MTKKEYNILKSNQENGRDVWSDHVCPPCALSEGSIITESVSESGSSSEPQELTFSTLLHWAKPAESYLPTRIFSFSLLIANIIAIKAL